LNVLSLFDGISCGQVALQRTGIQVNNYYASEIDKYAISIAKKNFPNIIELGDITQIKEEKLRELPKIDLIMAGAPCTGFSVAGQGLNFEDPQSKLFFDFIRIKEWLQKNNNPNLLFLLENVRMKAEWMNVITEQVGVEPILINSSLLSAQNRKRLYWTNIPDVTMPEDKGIPLSAILEEEVDKKYYINTDRAIEICDIEAQRGKIAYIGKDSIGNRVYSIHGKSVTLTANSGGWGGKTGLYWIPCLTPDRTNQRQNGPRFKPSDAKFYTLTALDRHGVLTQGQIRRLTPLEAERLQTLPDGYTDNGISDNQRYKCIGNGWTVDVIAHILRGIV
jgi:DNA-cytosine methyltransferase